MSEQCCRRCDTCQGSVCDEFWPPNTCDHGFVICEDCRPGECVECAVEVAVEVAA